MLHYKMTVIVEKVTAVLTHLCSFNHFYNLFNEQAPNSITSASKGKKTVKKMSRNTNITVKL